MGDAFLHSDRILNIGVVLWGIALIALTMAMHAVGIPATRFAVQRLWTRWPPRRGAYGGAPVLILASWMIVVVHLLEVIVWSAFLLWRGALNSAADAFYFTLCQYVTVGSDLSLPDRWRLLGGMIAMAGLLTFAWSTAVLLTLEQRVEKARLAALGDHAHAGLSSGPPPRPSEAGDG